MFVTRHERRFGSLSDGDHTFFDGWTGVGQVNHIGWIEHSGTDKHIISIYFGKKLVLEKERTFLILHDKI